VDGAGPPRRRAPLARRRRGKLYVLDDRARAWVLDTEDRTTFAFRRAASVDGSDHLIEADQIDKRRPGRHQRVCQRTPYA